jgi:hypothetical protein
MDKKSSVFNKEKFAELLDRAKGNRSINKYAEEADISAAHISRFLRQMIDTPPTPETISKLSLKAYNDVSYRDFMIAAGHIDVDNNAELLTFQNNSDLAIQDFQQRTGRVSRVSPLERRQQIEEMERKYIQVILAHLYEVDYPWGIKKPERRPYRNDMVIDIDHEGYKRWIFEFKASVEDRVFMLPLIRNVYSQFVMRDIEPTDKLTIAVNTENFYEQFFKYPPKSLRANLYVMLVDLHKGKIVKEEKLCSYELK